jgi:hypothetical protein
MKLVSFALIIFLISSATFSQAQLTMDIGSQSSNWGSTNSVNVVDPATLGSKKVELLNYSDIEGSPFYNQKWSKAFLYLKNGNLVKIDRIKLNMYSNEVDYINNNNVEMVLEAVNFKKIIVMKQDDTSHIAAIFECYPDMTDATKGEAFYRVLNGGIIQLYTLEKTILKTGAYDPLLGKDPKSFYTKKFYALTNSGAFSPIKLLDRNTILPLIKSHQEDEDWLDGNRNKLKNEKEVIAFFEFFNSKKNKN